MMDTDHIPSLFTSPGGLLTIGTKYSTDKHCIRSNVFSELTGRVPFLSRPLSDSFDFLNDFFHIRVRIRTWGRSTVRERQIKRPNEENVNSVYRCNLFNILYCFPRLDLNEYNDVITSVREVTVG
jgi:hypothetical protein